MEAKEVIKQILLEEEKSLIEYANTHGGHILLHTETVAIHDDALLKIYRAGMQEVMEFVESMLFYMPLDITSGKYSITLQTNEELSYQKWQVFKKEHGL